VDKPAQVTLDDYVPASTLYKYEQPAEQTKEDLPIDPRTGQPIVLTTTPGVEDKYENQVAAKKPIDVDDTANLYYIRLDAPQEQPKPSIIVVITTFVREIQMKLQNIRKKLRSFAEKQQDKINNYLAELKKGVEDKLINLVPVKSDVKNKLDKKQLIEYRKAKIQHTKKTLKRYLTYLRAIFTQITPSALKLVTNFVQLSEYRYTKNESSINKLIDGIFAIKTERVDAQGGSRTEQAAKKKELRTQQADIKNEIKDYLYGAELLVDFAKKTSEDIKQTNFLGVFAQRMERILVMGDGRHNMKEI